MRSYHQLISARKHQPCSRQHLACRKREEHVNVHCVALAPEVTTLISAGVHKQVTSIVRHLDICPCSRLPVSVRNCNIVSSMFHFEPGKCTRSHISCFRSGWQSLKPGLIHSHLFPARDLLKAREAPDRPREFTNSMDVSDVPANTHVICAR